MSCFIVIQAAQELKELRRRNAEQARGVYKNKIEKYYKELMKKGVNVVIYDSEDSIHSLPTYISIL